MKRIDLTGRKFNRWTVLCLDKEKTVAKHTSYWLCRCDCGRVASIFGGNLTKGKTKSCGCLRDELASRKNGTHREHGTILYNRWANIKERCSRPGNKIYHDRGIRVCEEWQDYLPFKKWALANGYEDSLQIDRIDNKKGYSPNNCRWVSCVENQNNRTDNVKVTFMGETYTLSEWSKKKNIPYKTLWRRYRDLKWPFEMAITTPVRPLNHSKIT